MPYQRDQYVTAGGTDAGVEGHDRDVRGMSRASLISSTGNFGESGKMFSAMTNGTSWRSISSIARKLDASRRVSTRTTAPSAPLNRPFHRNQNRSWPGVPNR